jgi:hypothetical protein
MPRVKKVEPPKSKFVSHPVPDPLWPAGLPRSGFLRTKDVIGQPEVTPDRAARNRKLVAAKKRQGLSSGLPVKTRSRTVGLVPISDAIWYKGIQEGRFPAPIELSPRARGYRVLDIANVILKLEGVDLAALARKAGAK